MHAFVSTITVLKPRPAGLRTAFLRETRWRRWRRSWDSGGKKNTKTQYFPKNYFLYFCSHWSAPNCEVMFESLSSQAANCSLLTNWGIYKGNMDDSYAIQLTEQVTVHGEKVFNFPPQRGGQKSLTWHLWRVLEYHFFLWLSSH